MEYPKTALCCSALWSETVGVGVRDQAAAGEPDHSGVCTSGSGFWHNALQMTQMHPTPAGQAATGDIPGKPPVWVV